MSRARTARAQPSPAPSSGRWPITLVGVVAVLLLGIAAYSSSLHGEFVFDDLPNTTGLGPEGDLSSLLSLDGYRRFASRYVAFLTFGVNRSLGGFDPFGWHVANLLIHLGNGLLIWALVQLAFASPRLRSSVLAPASRAIAFASSALFVAHPLATQAVSYVVQRMTSLATFFYLLATVAYLAWRLGRGGRTRPLLYVGVLLSALLAVRTKEIAFTLPAALALVDWALLEGRPRRWLPLVPVVAIVMLVPLTLLDLGKPVGEVLEAADTTVRAQTEVSRIDYLRTQSVVVARYLGMLVVPVGQALDHDVEIRRSWLAPDVGLSVLVEAALVALALWLGWCTRPGGARTPLDPSLRFVSLGIGWFFVALSIESSIIPIADVMNEHRVYLPMAGLIPGAVVAVSLLLHRIDPLHVARNTAVLGGVTASLLGVITWNRNLVWRNDDTLWGDALEKSPGHLRPLRKVGAIRFEQGRTAEAISLFRLYATRYPDLPGGHVQLGVALFFAGQPEEAERELRTAVAVSPDDPDALFNLAYLLVRTGRTALARPYLERLLVVDNDPEKQDWARSLLAP